MIRIEASRTLEGYGGHFFTSLCFHYSLNFTFQQLRQLKNDNDSDSTYPFSYARGGVEVANQGTNVLLQIYAEIMRSLKRLATITVPVMAAVTARKKVVSIGQFSPRFCF